MNNRLILILVAAGIFLLGLPLYANARVDDKSLLPTKDFVKKVSVANMFEVQSSQLALDKSNNRDVRDFAETMVDDHSKAQDRLREAVKESNIEAPLATALDTKHRNLLEKLKAIPAGDEFDREYISIHVSAHNDAVDLFKKYSENGGDNSVRKFAEQTLPTLEDHSKHIKEIKDKEAKQ